MPSQFASQYAPHLPEVGSPVTNRAKAIIEGRAAAEKALTEAIAEHAAQLAYWNAQETLLASDIRLTWKPAEIVAAMEAAD